jgi:putative ABC transport system permease protein
LQKLNLGTGAIGRKVDEQYEVAGVLKDFNFASLQHKIDALGVFVTTDTDTTAMWAKNGGCLYAKLHAEASTAAVIQQLKEIFDSFDNTYPFDYYFLDEVYDAQYKAEERLLKIVQVFTVLTVLIACLGLFGLSAFVIVQRTKEIGIRKVLGASLAQIVALLSRDFMKLVALAIVIASPLAWYVMEKWLQGFAYRIPVTVEVFLYTACAVIFIALLTILFQALKAATANPVKNLCTE